MKTFKMMALALAGLTAAPLMAQTPQMPPPAPETAAQKAYEGNRHDRTMHGLRGLQSMTPEGRQIMRDAMRKGHDPAQRAAIQEARNRVMTIVSADRLDVGALRSAMEAERRLADQRHARRQANMVEAFQKLSAEDRRAFVADARAGRDQMKQRMERRSMERAPAS
ncbi:MAG: hypothetical protein KGZ61_02055 [Sandarakinorhabdus sp.]|nr:hypothetical protein [Sandarakinorhabdus sp.]